MKKFASPLIAAAVAAAIAGTTGYCSFGGGQPTTTDPAIYVSPPVRLLPDAVVPYPPTDPE